MAGLQNTYFRLKARNSLHDAELPPFPRQTPLSCVEMDHCSAGYELPAFSALSALTERDWSAPAPRGSPSTRAGHRDHTLSSYTADSRFSDVTKNGLTSSI